MISIQVLCHVDDLMHGFVTSWENVLFTLENRGVTIYRYIGISQYAKNLYRIAIRNVYRNISRIFLLSVKLFIFHSFLVI